MDSEEPKWATELREMIRQIVREEIALHMERVVRYRAWLPAGVCVHTPLRSMIPRSSEPRPAREETPQ